MDENWGTTAFLDSQPGGIKDCISSELLEHMNQADIMCLNNEFTYSTRGEKMPGKQYTFRANPDRVKVLEEMGVDIVKLSNNHTFDYGSQSLLDTIETLDNAEIEYFGAGRNLKEAMTPVYIEVDGKKVALGGNLDVKVIPAIQKEYKTGMVKEEREKERIYSFLEEISINVEIDDEGYVLEKTKQ